MKPSVAERFERLAGPLLVTAVAVALGSRTWQVWGDPVVDYGREIYLAWRLSEGAVLYRDVAYFNGPLSSYVNAAWFNLVGPGVLQLATLNLLVLVAVTAVLFAICESLGDRVTATVASVVFLTLHGLAYFGRGTYNFVTPYSHDVTYGLLLGLLAVAVVGVYAKTGRRRWAFVLGLVVGLSFLTKPETFLATAAAAGLGLIAALWHDPGGVEGQAPTAARRPVTSIVTALAGALVAPLGAFVALATSLGPGGAREGLLHQWVMVADGRITALPFYRWVAGLDAVGANVLALVAWTLGASLVLAVLAWCSRFASDRAVVRSTVLVAVAFICLVATPWIPWNRVWFVLPAGVAVLLVDSGIRLARRKGEASSEVTAFALGALALVLLLKQGVYPRVFHYGFALTVPAVALCVVGMTNRIPSRLRSGGDVFRTGALGIIAAISLVHLGLSRHAVASARASSAPVGLGADVLQADTSRASVLREVIDIVASKPSETTVAVLPEGAYLNFVTRRTNPTGFVQLMPPELITWGEHEVVEAFRRAPPDLVVLLHRNLSQYSTGPFGAVYGAELLSWLRVNYRSLRVIGHVPFSDGGAYGAEILEREKGTSAQNLAAFEPADAGLLSSR